MPGIAGPWASKALRNWITSTTNVWNTTEIYIFFFLYFYFFNFSLIHLARLLGIKREGTMYLPVAMFTVLCYQDTEVIAMHQMQRRKKWKVERSWLPLFFKLILSMFVCVCVCARAQACVRACVCAHAWAGMCVCACVHACVGVRMHACFSVS